jgi:hypothetical protein
MTTLVYYILKSRFWQQIVMTSPPNLGGEGELGKEGYASRVNLSLSTKNPPQSNLTPCHGEDAIANVKARQFVIQIAWTRRGTLALLHSCNSKGIGGDSANLRISDLNTS